ncbi:hypothetical protein EDD37DRAFT_682032 [Exophiala viscosa]|uniref:uncharacterized protein n=1 Tax=Exophiala viscosa TaxID=2486360 RepID=UPI00219D281C|nr:hypothetical protein EDD37DRAFT_682032 [Exophiala viscosa]
MSSQAPTLVDPETHTEALPYRPHRSGGLQKFYRTACCGSIVGILLWVFALLFAIFVPIGALLARGQLHSSGLNTASTSMSTLTTTSTTTAVSTDVSRLMSTITTVSIATTVSISIVTSMVTSISVSIVTYSPPPTVTVTTALTTTDGTTSLSTVTEESDTAAITETIETTTIVPSPSTSAPSTTTSIDEPVVVPTTVFWPSTLTLTDKETETLRASMASIIVPVLQPTPHSTSVKSSPTKTASIKTTKAPNHTCKGIESPEDCLISFLPAAGG